MPLIPSLDRNISEFKARLVYKVSSMRLCFKNIKTKNNQRKPRKFKLPGPTKYNLLAFLSSLFGFFYLHLPIIISSNTPTPGRIERLEGQGSAALEDLKRPIAHTWD